MAKKKFRKYGYIPDIKSHNDLKFVRPAHLAEGPLPSSVDLRDKMPAIYDQGELGSCTANAIAGDLEYNQIKEGKDHYNPSRLFIYYNERVIENTVSEDAGAMLRDGIKAVVQWGYAKESDWPYDISKFTRKPPVSIYRNAITNRIQQYARISQDLDDMRACLADGGAFFFGFSVYESFEGEDIAKTGIMPMPKLGEQMLGGHAILAVGYDDAKQTFIIRNSWGEGWGDRGYFYMPYSFIADGMYANDFWCINYVP